MAKTDKSQPVVMKGSSPKGGAQKAQEPEPLSYDPVLVGRCRVYARQGELIPEHLREQMKYPERRALNELVPPEKRAAIFFPTLHARVKFVLGA